MIDGGLAVMSEWVSRQRQLDRGYNGIAFIMPYWSVTVMNDDRHVLTGGLLHTIAQHYSSLEPQ